MSMIAKAAIPLQSSGRKPYNTSMEQYAYTLIRSKRKTIALQVTPALEVLVRAPQRAPKRELDRFVAAHTDWIRRQMERQQQRALERPAPTEEELRALKACARAELPPLVEHYARLMGLSPTGVKITSAKTRYGSCSARNSLCFSCLLMRAPRPAIEYVVVHELAHIPHKNHGPDFYALVERILPDYKVRRKLLKG